MIFHCSIEAHNFLYGKLRYGQFLTHAEWDDALDGYYLHSGTIAPPAMMLFLANFLLACAPDHLASPSTPEVPICCCPILRLTFSGHRQHRLALARALPAVLDPCKCDCQHRCWGTIWHTVPTRLMPPPSNHQFTKAGAKPGGGAPRRIPGSSIEAMDPASMPLLQMR